MSVKLPRPPRMEMLLTTDAQGRVTVNQGVLRDIRVYFEALSKIISFDSGSVDWTAINFDGSKLQDLATRRHSDLQIIEQLDLNDTNTDKTKHLSNAQGKVWEDHKKASTDVHGIGSASSVVGTETSQTIKNKINDSTNKYGGSTNYSDFEADGTLHFTGDATVWKDVMFPMAPPKTSGAGNPTLTTYNGNMRGYAFALNDAHDFDPQEMVHDAKVGSTATWHVHWLTRSNDGTDRTVKWQLEYAIEPASGAVPSPTTVTAEITIPAGTTVNTVQRDNITTFTIPAIARLAYARISRIASSGTEPATDPILSGLHFHYCLDTVGSRDITTK